MRHSWVMYAALLILAVILVTHAAGSTGILLAGSSAGSNVITAFQGPPSTQSGSFQLGGGRSFSLG